MAHYRVKDDESCIEKIREIVSELPVNQASPVSVAESEDAARPLEDLYTLLPENHRQPYDAHEVLRCILDAGHLDEFQADYAREMITGHARIRGIQVGIIANSRGLVREQGKPPKFGGIIYTDSAEKAAYFIDLCNRQRTPLVFVQDVRIHGRGRGRALRDHPRGRSLRRGDGDRHRP